MASSPALRARIVANASAEEVAQFQVLWNESLKLRDQGQIVYFIPRGMGIDMGTVHLKEVAATMRDILKTPVHVHFDVERSAYRIGQVFDADNEAVHRCIFVFTAEYPPTLNATKSASDVAPASQSAQSSSTPSDVNKIPLEQKVEKIPKPRNMWILYRQDKHSTVLAQNPGMYTSKISTIIAEMWKNESQAVKGNYKKLADEEKAKHQLRYPTYKCSPRKSSEIKKRKRSTKGCLDITEETPAAKATRLADDVVQHAQNPTRSRREESRAGLEVYSNVTSLKAGGSIFAPYSQETTPAIDWQSFGSFQDMEHASEQPPKDLFVDDDTFQLVDWDASGGAFDWLS